MTKIRRYKLESPARTRNYRVRYEDQLNSEQLEVVMAGDGPMLVIAGAGTGKTRTLTYRVSRLIEDGVDPSSILLVTFTNKAAREMLGRVEELVAIDTRSISGGTFHSVGNRLLRQHAERLGYRSNFSILDSEDSKEMMETAITAAGIPTLEKRFPKGDVLLEIHSFVANTATPLEAHLEENYPHFATWLSEIRSVFAQYAHRKLEANVMDFDDLLLNWKRLLDEHPEAAEVLRIRYRHLLVDEYQDTNRLQAEIIDSMAAHHRNVMVVGDDAQSIYSFRGASFENIITFPQRFPDARVFKLETNYRSSPQILSLANAAIAHNRFQFPKQLHAVRGSGPDPAMVGVDDVYEQASFVAQRILELRDEGESLDEIAILYRSHYQSLELQMELSRRMIPYEIRSGVRFFEQAHIKDVLGYLKIITNPTDELSWKRTLKLYPKIGTRTASEIWSELSRSRDPLGTFLAGRIQIRSRGAGESVRSLRHTLETLSRDAMKRSPSEAIRLILTEGYGDYVRAKFPNSDARLDDLEQLSNYALRYDDVDAFLNELALSNPLSGEDVAALASEDERVILSSVHQAKGLEWRTVFVIWLADGRFPSVRAMRGTGAIIRIRKNAPPIPEVPVEKLLTGNAEGGDEPVYATVDRGEEIELSIPGEEEERRLFYVALTRAMNEVYLVYPVMARDRMQMDVLMEPSRFVRELPGDLYEKWVIG
ncbi:MAG: ATP-dependent helicase [Thermoanaerobaculia bacterium]